MVQFAVNSEASAIQTKIEDIAQRQRVYFRSGATRSIEFRLEQLKRLRQAVLDREAAIMQAVQADLRKPDFEAFFEMGVVQEIDAAIKNLRRWMKPKSVGTPPEQFPAKAQIVPEPLGVVLIIGPWNYPFQLVISPLVGAIAAGNCALVKPSEVASHTSRVVADLIETTFDPQYIAAIEGGVDVSQAVLNEKFDHIFFTGGTAIGKIVMSAAAKHLTPVTLELGGKSPCIVDTDIDLQTAVKRIVWGKFINAGQTCIAPDYLLVDRRIKPQVIEAITATLRELYGEDPANSPDYGRIISDRHYERLVHLMQGGQAILGGQTNRDDRYIAPTVLDSVNLDSPLMQEEIFGPLLPVIEYGDIQEAIDLILSKPKPLALYLFSRNSQLQQRILQETSSGGVCLNETVMHVGVAQLPFGGVGESGIGKYHGKASFDTFSHYKSVLAKPFWLDLPWRYAPYEGKLEQIKKLLKK
ncbi:aldehyde dehydrogenase [Leptolyngbya ohadii]|uniref:aldehyde dehydrogenase n=1 Tax=Leptolyngbya ohadii TaxID=1962290 RepID=UPI000B59E528|nr:aldehyde dehydrogenase [Leptolyngbya ohadii]